MSFRRLHWVLERVGADGTSSVAGVFTSVADLVSRGFAMAQAFAPDTHRFALVQLDSTAGPLGVYAPPAFDGLAATLKEILDAGDISSLEASMLAAHLGLGPIS